MKESRDYKIAKLTQEIENLQQYLLDQNQSEPVLKREMQSRCKDFQKALCKTDKELRQLKEDTQKTEVELTKAKTRFNAFVKYMKKNMKQALYAKKKLTEFKKETTISLGNSENSNSEYLKDWILKEIEQAVCEKIAHHKMEAAQEEIFNIRNEIHKHNDEVEIYSLKKQLEFQQEKLAALEGLPGTESKVEMLFDMLNNKEDLKIALSSIFDMLIAKEAEFVFNAETSQEVFFKQQEKENMIMKQNVKKDLEDYDLEKKGLQTCIAQLERTIKLQNEKIKVLKRALDAEIEEKTRARRERESSSSMLGEYLAELEDEKESISSISSSNSDDHTQKSPKFNQSPFRTRKRSLDMKKRSPSLTSEGVPPKLIALSCSVPAKTLNRTTDCSSIRHNEN
ncbi:myosin heavy chain, clone 203-like [Uloborus diversus]|uniref:myosin heavy chain, clone 203-like n=1 Tax=Uloborus diversus TaxID=327109 RepID=UPI002408F645|nr:myosin heavy chain, clone 203-like [Uloborus diversus]